ncbi:MAG: AI-2E family transporter [bacterium]|nr:AI-2E family transporter [Clostridium sp.]MCM1538422.1 AI-2E family transporter [bacterium]
MGNFFEDLQEEWSKKRALRVGVIAAAVYLAMKYALPLVLPFCLSVLFVRFSMPLLRRLSGRRRGMKSTLTALFLSVIGALPIVLLLLLYRAAAGCVRACMSYFGVLRVQCGVFLHTCCCYLERPLGIDAAILEERIMTAARSIGEQISDEAIPKALVLSGDVIGVLAAVGISWAVFFIFSVLLAKDYDEIVARWREKHWFGRVRELYDKTVRMVFSYAKAQLIIMSVIGGICSVAFWWAGFGMPFLWGYVVGFLDMLPFIGTGITLLPLALFELIMGDGMLAVVFAALYMVCYFVREFMEPRLIGQRIGIHPLIILMSVFLGVKLYGLLGIVTGPLSYLLIRELSE